MEPERTVPPKKDAGAPRGRAVLLAGLYGSAWVTLLSALVHTLFIGFPFPPTAVAQTVVGAPPGAFDSFFIERIGHWAGYLSVGVAAVCFALSGLAIGWLVTKAGALRAWPWMAAFGALWASTVILYQAPSPSLSRAAFAAVSAPLFFIGALVALRSAAGSAEVAGTGEAAPGSPETPLGTSRRYFLKASGVGVAGVALGVSNIGRIWQTGTDPGTMPLGAPDIVRAPSPPADADFGSIRGLSPEVTPAGDFYVVDKDLINPLIRPSEWRLAVRGRVRQALRLGHSELLSMKIRERYQTLECISNVVGGPLISTALWAGIPLGEIIGRARPHRDVRTVIFRCAGGYTESFPFEQAIDPTTWLVVGMNGNLLPRVHGFPARILSLGTYGMKNPKWLTEIVLSPEPVYEGYWEVRGWSAGADVKIMSRFDVPGDGATRSSPVTFAGVAFAADRGIGKVEVSTDGGETWDAASLKRPLSPYAWRLWRYVWTPPRSGTFRCAVRAYDGRGNRQVQGSLDPFPRGTSGYDTVIVTVT